jgi:hypothetical protein
LRKENARLRMERDRPRPPARQARPSRHTHESRPAGRRHAPRGNPARRRGPEHRPVPLRGWLRAPLRAAPIPVSSGKTDRHRLDYGAGRTRPAPPAPGRGNRAANRALHMIVIVRLRHCERTRTYCANASPGKSKREAIICLKR